LNLLAANDSAAVAVYSHVYTSPHSSLFSLRIFNLRNEKLLCDRSIVDPGVFQCIRIKRELIHLIPVILLVLAIGLSPSIILGTIAGEKSFELRAEDILLVVLGLAWFGNFAIARKKKLKRPPLLFPIFAWLGIGFLSVVTNLLFHNIEFQRSFFFFLKEIEFFVLYFYLFYHVYTFHAVKFILKVWIGIGLIHALWIIFEVLTGLEITYYYGPTLFIEPEGTFPGGGFIVILAAFLLQVLLYYYLNMPILSWKKVLLAIAVVSPAVAVFSSGSRTSFLGYLFMLAITFFLYMWKTRSKQAVLRSSFILLLVGIAFLFLFFGDASVERRLFHIDEGIASELNPENKGRLASWQTQLSNAFERPQFLLFGFGKSVKLPFGESHSQYVRNFIETGIIGSVVFLLLMFLLVKKAWREFRTGKNALIAGLSAGVLVSTLTMLIMSIAADAFIVVKIGEVYWFFIALSMTTLYLWEKEKQGSRREELHDKSK